MRLTARKINFVAFLCCILLLIVSFYFQFADRMQPCLLCILQRWVMGALMIIFLLAAIQNPKKMGVRIYAAIAFLFAVLGAVLAGRQVWLQHQPPSPQETCLPGLQFLLQTRPLPEVVKIMFHGGSDCAEVTWRFLGMTMAEWTLLIFILVAIFSLIVFVVRKN